MENLLSRTSPSVFVLRNHLLTGSGCSSLEISNLEIESQVLNFKFGTGLLEIFRYLKIQSHARGNKHVSRNTVRNTVLIF